jgi:hypothetical protein
MNESDRKKIKNTLIFPCGSAIGLELHKFLRYSSMFRIFGGASVKDHGSFVFENLITDLPFIDDEDFLQKLNGVIQNQEIDFLFPTTDRVALIFSEWAKDNKLQRAEVMTSSYETCRIAYSKKETYELFDGIIPTPRVHLSSQEIDKYPVFLKPETGSGGLGTHIAYSKKEVDFYLSIDSSLLILEYLPGNEYTVDCLTDMKGNLRFAQGRIKSRYIYTRYMGHCEIAKNNQIPNLAEKINQTLDLRGTWFCQFKENDRGELILLEVAVRIAASTSFHWLNSVNLPLLALHDALGYEIELNENDYGLEMDRTLWYYRYAINYEFDYIYMSFDDSLILRDMLNYKLLALLYKFRSEGKSISLIVNSSSRDDALYKMKLKEHMIPIKLFDKVIEIPEGATKSEFIQKKGAILIDSSLIDRNEAASKINIPVFDVNQVIEIFKD